MGLNGRGYVHTLHTLDKSKRAQNLARIIYVNQIIFRCVANLIKIPSILWQSLRIKYGRCAWNSHSWCPRWRSDGYVCSCLVVNYTPIADIFS